MEKRKKLFIEPYSFFFHKIFCTLQIILKLRVKSHFHAIYLYKYKGFVILQVILRRVVWDTSQYVMQCFPRGINRMNIPTVTSSFFVSKCQAFVLRKIMLLMGDFRILSTWKHCITTFVVSADPHVKVAWIVHCTGWNVFYSC